VNGVQKTAETSVALVPFIRPEFEQEIRNVRSI
jgi:hypothetical protein